MHDDSEGVFSLIIGVLMTVPCCFFADVNECRMNLRLCQQDCVNTVGSYRCECRSGYVLKTDRRGCQGIALLTGQSVKQFLEFIHVSILYKELK